MTSWCSEHPWMTLFIILSIIEALRAMVVSFNGGCVCDHEED